MEGVLDRAQEMALQRELQFRVSISDEHLLSDAVLLNSILQNVVANATSHARRGSTIEIEVSAEGLSVRNEAPDLKNEDLTKLFERFWQKNKSAPENSDRSGIDLSIVRASADLLRYPCTVELSAGFLLLRVEFDSKN